MNLVNELPTEVWIFLSSLVLLTTILSTTFYISCVAEFVVRGIRGMRAELTPFVVISPAVCWTIYIVFFK